jgi:RNA polymerase-binding transcription factor DksA
MDAADQEHFRQKIEAWLTELKAGLATGQDATAPVQRLEAPPDAPLCVNCAGANPGR